MRPSWKRNTPRFVRCALYLVALSPVLLSMGAAYLNHEPKGAHEVDEKSARSFRAALARDVPDFERAYAMVMANADVDSPLANGEPPFQYLLRRGREFESEAARAVVREVVPRMGSINARDLRGFTPLLAAVAARDIEVVRLLVESGARMGEPAIPDGGDNLAAAHAAVYLGRGEASGLARALLRRATLARAGGAALPQKPPRWTGTNLLAARAEVEEVAALFEDAAEGLPTSASVSFTAAAGAMNAWAALFLHEVMQPGEHRGAEALLLHDPIIGRTPLHVACAHGNAEAAGLMLDLGADMRAVDVLGQTPLHLAAKGGHEALVKVLEARAYDFLFPFSLRPGRGARVLEARDLLGRQYGDLSPRALRECRAQRPFDGMADACGDARAGLGAAELAAAAAEAEEGRPGGSGGDKGSVADLFFREQNRYDYEFGQRELRRVGSGGWGGPPPQPPRSPPGAPRALPPTAGRRVETDAQTGREREVFDPPYYHEECGIPAVNGSIPAYDFLVNHVLAGRPVMMRGAAAHWPWTRRWRKAEFVSRHGHERFQISAVDEEPSLLGLPALHVPLVDYVNMWQRPFLGTLSGGCVVLEAERGEEASPIPVCLPGYADTSRGLRGTEHDAQISAIAEQVKECEAREEEERTAGGAAVGDGDRGGEFDENLAAQMAKGKCYEEAREALSLAPSFDMVLPPLMFASGLKNDSALLEHVPKVPPFLDWGELDGPLGGVALPRPTQRWHFTFGPERAGANPHVHGDAWHALAHGAQRWHLFAPGAERAYSAKHARAWMFDDMPHTTGAGLTCVQRTGDILFIPAGWGHASLHLEQSIGMGAEFRWARSFLYRQKKAGTKDEGAAPGEA